MLLIQAGFARVVLSPVLSPRIRRARQQRAPRATVEERRSASRSERRVGCGARPFSWARSSLPQRRRSECQRPAPLDRRLSNATTLAVGELHEQTVGLTFDELLATSPVDAAFVPASGRYVVNGGLPEDVKAALRELPLFE